MMRLLITSVVTVILTIVVFVGLFDYAKAYTTVSMLNLTQLPTSTVATIPACNAANIGVMYLVTDALTPVALAVVAGSGAVKVPVVCNGTSYIVS